MPKKTPEAPDPTRGAEALVAEAPAIVVAGREYKMRRLGVQDTFRLARIISAGAMGLGQKVEDLDLTPETLVLLLTASLPYAERPIIELLASVIGVSYEEFTDPNQFPMDSVLQILEGLAQHQDLRAFFVRLGKLLESPMLQDSLGIARRNSSSAS